MSEKMLTLSVEKNSSTCLIFFAKSEVSKSAVMGLKINISLNGYHWVNRALQQDVFP